MKILLRNKSIIVLSILVNICLLFAINYAVGSVVKGELRPYYLGDNYLEFSRIHSTDIPTKEVIDFTQYEDLIVIAELEERKKIGILDLQMKIYAGSTKVTAPNVYRYFSIEDYQNQTNVGIVVNICDFFDLKAVKKSNTQYNVDEVINCLEYESWNGEPITLLQNLYAIDFNKVSTLFIDSSDNQEILHIKNKLLNNGFELVEKSYNPPLFTISLSSLMGSKHEQFLIGSSISAFIMYLFMTFIFSRKYKRHIQINRIAGGSLSSMLKHGLAWTISISLIVSILIFIVFIYFEVIDENNLTWWSVIKLQGFMLLCNILIFSINLLYQYKKATNLIGRT